MRFSKDANYMKYSVRFLLLSCQSLKCKLFRPPRMLFIQFCTPFVTCRQPHSKQLFSSETYNSQRIFSHPLQQTCSESHAKALWNAQIRTKVEAFTLQSLPKMRITRNRKQSGRLSTSLSSSFGRSFSSETCDDSFYVIPTCEFLFACKIASASALYADRYIFPNSDAMNLHNVRREFRKAFN